MRLFAVFVALLLLAAGLSAYTDRSYSLDVQLKPDGNAHVVEKALLNLDSPSEIDAFEFVLREGKTTLADWQKFSRNIRYHITGSVFNVRIVSAREFTTSFTSASVTLEYDVENVTLFKPLSSRKTGYSFQNHKLVLGSAPGEIRLGNNMVFALRLPSDAIRVRVSPDAGAVREGTAIRWFGPTAGTWDVYFEREITLGDEVNQFFLQTFTSLSTSYILWILLAFAVFLVGYKVLRPNS